jgi:tetratricopeptide (TPR) repeat protein
MPAEREWRREATSSILQIRDNTAFHKWQYRTMKINMTAIFAALLISGGIASAATNDITALLQKGLFEEEANHNLEAAMRQYQAAVDGFDQDRQLAATAVFRLGECYRKLGKTNEADVQYQRVLREFADQTTLAGLSREYLAGKTPSATEVLTIPAAATSAEDEEVRKIREMIRNSPDLINAPTTSGGPTPLQNAVVLGNIAAAELLLANGADVNGAWQGNTVESRKTPLSLAAERGNKGMIELLLAKGANVNAPDRNNDVYTPLHHAVQQGFKTAAEVLLAHKADVNARSRDQLTPLHNAAGRGFNAVAELLLAHGADVNAASSSGYTPLHFAVRDNWPEMVNCCWPTRRMSISPISWGRRRFSRRRKTIMLKLPDCLSRPRPMSIIGTRMATLRSWSPRVKTKPKSSNCFCITKPTSMPPWKTASRLC